MAQFEIEVRSNIKELQAQVSRLGRQFDSIGTRGVTKLNRNLRTTERTTSNIERNMKRAFSAAVLGGAVRTVTRLADRFTRAENALRPMSESAAELNGNMASIFELAQENSVRFEDMANTFALIANAGERFNFTLGQSRRLTETISAGIAAFNIPQAQANSLLLQYTQSLTEGRVTWENIKAIQEAAPQVYAEIEKGVQELLGTEQALSQLVKAGLVDSELLAKATLARRDAILKLRDAANLTFGQAFTRAGNALVLFTSRIVNSGEFGQQLIDILNNMSDVLRNNTTVAWAQAAIQGLLFAGVVRTIGGALSNTVGFLAGARSEYAKLTEELDELTDAQDLAVRGQDMFARRQTIESDTFQQNSRRISDKRRRLGELEAQYGNVVKAGTGFIGLLKSIVTSLNFWLIAVGVGITLFDKFNISLNEHREILKDLPDITAKYREEIEKANEALEDGNREAAESSARALEVQVRQTAETQEGSLAELRNRQAFLRSELNNPEGSFVDPLSGEFIETQTRSAEATQKLTDEFNTLAEEIRVAEEAYAKNVEALRIFREEGIDAFLKYLDDVVPEEGGRRDALAVDIDPDDPTQGGYLGKERK